MKPILLAVLLITVTSAACAEWVLYGHNDKFGVYTDPATMRRSGDRVKMWNMFGFNIAQVAAAGMAYLSAKTLNEYDCKDERSRSLFFSWHSGRMGDGSIVYFHDGPPSNWRAISPSSVDETLWKIACGKK